ncbi:hypothetical protein Ancab_026817 [Ancistrocladus abbreviatus]
MQRIYSQLIWSRRSYCASSKSNTDKIVASVLFERLPVVVPKIDPVVYDFQEFSFRCQQQYQRIYPHEFWAKVITKLIMYQLHGSLKHTKLMTEVIAESTSRRLYLLLYGTMYGAPNEKPVWHFPEKV